SRTINAQRAVRSEHLAAGGSVHEPDGTAPAREVRVLVVLADRGATILVREVARDDDLGVADGASQRSGDEAAAGASILGSVNGARGGDQSQRQECRRYAETSPHDHVQAIATPATSNLMGCPGGPPRMECRSGSGGRCPPGPTRSSRRTGSR